jgi:hypothetical protein
MNGLWSGKGQKQIDRQAALLPYVDGSAVEFHGYDGQVTAGTFDIFVKRLNDAIAAHPTKPFLVRGTSAYLTQATSGRCQVAKDAAR